jgi:hypothetical protein
MKESVKTISLLIALLLVVSTFSAVFIKTGASAANVVEPKGIDENVKAARLDNSEQIEPLGDTHHSYWNVGDTAIWTGYLSPGSIFLTYYTLSYIGTNVEIWVQNNIRFPSGDPRNGPLPYDNLRPTKPTYAMLQYLADQYEQNILPTESAFFGAPVFHDGSNAQLQYVSPAIPDDPEYYHEPTGRAVILVCNIRDDNYYDYTYPYYVIGVHIGDYEDFYYDRNVVTLDAVSWYHGLGPAGMHWGLHYYWPTNIFHDDGVSSPYAYDSTLAHEFQHLLHHELCPGDDLFMNEGCSMFAEMLCGYGLDPDYPNSYFATPDNSLTIWGDQGDINVLADYGAAALWTIYLSDQFGSSFLSYYFQSGGGGVAGITSALKHFHYHETFDTVYGDWKLANLIRQDFGCFKKYNYKSLNLNDPIFIPVMQYAIGGLPVPLTKGTDFGNTITILGYDTGISKVAQYGSDYIRFENWNKLGFLCFDGDDRVDAGGWSMTADGWWSGTGTSMQDTLIEGTATVNPADPTLTIVTKYNTEYQWDFGFVQVSTDNGQNWQSLANPDTTSTYLTDVPAIQANMPGFTGPSAGYPAWTTETFDLSAYTGQTVTIGFRYMTDEAVTLDGWWIQSATVSGTPITLSNPVTPPPATFKATVVQAVVICGKTYYFPYDLMLTKNTNKGTTLACASPPSFVVLIVTPTAPTGFNDYKFQASKIQPHNFCKDV